MESQPQQTQSGGAIFNFNELMEKSPPILSQSQQSQQYTTQELMKRVQDNDPTQSQPSQSQTQQPSQTSQTQQQYTTQQLMKRVLDKDPTQQQSQPSQPSQTQIYLSQLKGVHPAVVQSIKKLTKDVKHLKKKDKKKNIKALSRGDAVKLLLKRLQKKSFKK